MRTEIIIYLYQCIVTYIVNDEEALQEGNTKKKEKEANGEREREREREREMWTCSYAFNLSTVVVQVSPRG